MKHICPYCMEKLQGEVSVCPFCSFDGNDASRKVYHLAYESYLAKRYYIGRVIGEGGFGITYLGYDMKLDLKVAVKEYFPHGFVVRDVTGINGNTVSTFDGGSREDYEKYLNRFYNEAKTLARLRGLKGMVDVSDYFMENGTAYIVMDYIDGMDLDDYVKQHGGRMPLDDALDLLRPIAESLLELHYNGIIHRDLSPDNIRIDKEGAVKLLDLGASREFGDIQKSMSVILKPGYAPLEQYNSKAKQGPYTDVYSFCATLYRIITGERPLDVTERVGKDNIKTPSQLGIPITEEKESIIMKGLSVFAKNRYQDMYELIKELYAQPQEKEIHVVQKRKTKFVAGIVLACILFGVTISIALSCFSHMDKTQKTIEKTSELKKLPESFSVTTTEEGMRKLDLSSYGIMDITFLQQYDLSEIEVLDLSNNDKLVDIMGIEAFSNLKELDLGQDKKLENLQPLEKIADSLVSLHLEDDFSIKDFNVLSELKYLERLYLDSTEVSDLSFLKSLKNISELVLNSCKKIHDVSIVSELPQLLELDIGGCENHDIWKSLPSLPRLTALNISEYGLEDGDFIFVNYPNLEALNICFNGLKNLEEIGRLKKLKSLNAISATSDLTGIENLTRLRKLSIGSVFSTHKLKNTEKILKLPNLTELCYLPGSDDGKNIKWLSKTKNLVNLDIDLSNSFMHLSDFSIIANNRNLERLTITDALENKNLEALGNLEKLTDLKLESSSWSFDLEGTEKTDISWLCRLAHLEKLDLSLNGVKDYSSLSSLSSLKELSLKNMSDVTKYDFCLSLTNLTKLVLKDTGVADFSGLKNLSKLEELTIPNAYIMENSFLDNMISLRKLNLGTEKNTQEESGNILTDLDFIKKMKNLQSLVLSNRTIKDLDGLSGGKDLLILDLNNCIFDGDISILSKLKNLTSLELSDTSINDIKSLQKLPYLSNLNLARVKISNTEIDKKKNAFNNLRNLTINDTNLQSLEPFKEAEKLLFLNANALNIHSLRGLENCSELRTVSLKNMPSLQDISALKNTKKIVRFALSGCEGVILPINTVKPISQNTEMSVLRLKRLKIISLGDLTNMNRITLIDLGGNTSLTDISAMGYMQNIYSINLNGCISIQDIRALSTLTMVREATFRNCTSITDFSPLSNMVLLKKILLDGVKIDNLSFLANCEKLEELSMKNVQIQKVDCIDKMVKLEFLYLSNSNVKELPVLSKCKKLSYVDINNTQISSLAEFKYVPLEDLYIKGIPIKNLYQEILGLKNLSDNCSITYDEIKLSKGEKSKLERKISGLHLWEN